VLAVTPSYSASLLLIFNINKPGGLDGLRGFGMICILNTPCHASIRAVVGWLF
jgi:hypothetical protein